MYIPLSEAISYHVSGNAVDHVIRLVKKYGIQLRITRQRVTKLGDFRPSQNGHPHRVSVNGNLNKYEFLLVFLHEVAHLRVYQACGKSAKPHGKEWKQAYGELIREFIDHGCFQAHLAEVLLKYSYHVKSAGVASIEAAKILRCFDDHQGSASSWKFLEELSMHGSFQTGNGRLFRKTEKLRTRYKCRCLTTNRVYLIHKEAKVFPVQVPFNTAGLSGDNQTETLNLFP